MLAKARVNDVWTLGTPRGQFAPPEPGLREVFLCYGTGWAPVRAVLLSRVERAAFSATADAPAATSGTEAAAPAAASARTDLECSVYAIAPSPGYHYDCVVQDNLRQLDTELNFTWLVEAGDDPWLLGAQPTPVDIDFEVSADPIITAIQREDPDHSRFIISGPAEWAHTSAQKLSAAGISHEAIEVHAW